jgi:hypothetical protein
MRRTSSATGLLVALSVCILFSGSVAGAATWPKQLPGHLLDRLKSAPFGASVPKRDLISVGWMSSKNYIGHFTYALADIGHYEYPVTTKDAGRQWQVAGHFFNLDDTSGMGAGDSPSNIVTLSRTIAVAYRRGDIIGGTSSIYVTVDSGKRWFTAFAPGVVTAIKSVLAGPRDSVLVSLRASVSPQNTIGEQRFYVSLNAGRSWLLK